MATTAAVPILCIRRSASRSTRIWLPKSTDWRDATRTNDPMAQMRKVAHNLSDDDINDVATFLSQAPDSTVGDGTEIGNQTVLEKLKVVR